MVHLRAIALMAAATLVAAPQAARAQCLSSQGASNVAEGAVLGAFVGALAGVATSKNDRRAAQRGAAIGAVVGAGVGCWTAHGQAVRAARERALAADIYELARMADELEGYNGELALKVSSARRLSAQLWDESGRLNRSNRQLVDQGLRMRSAAVEELAEVEATLRAVNAQARYLDPRSQRGAIFGRQVAALGGARTQLQTVVGLLS